jgi:hypothetical protein
LPENVGVQSTPLSSQGNGRNLWGAAAWYNFGVTAHLGMLVLVQPHYKPHQFMIADFEATDVLPSTPPLNYRKIKNLVHGVDRGTVIELVSSAGKSSPDRFESLRRMY